MIFHHKLYMNNLSSQQKLKYVFSFQNILTNQKYKILLSVASILFVTILMNNTISNDEMDADMFAQITIPYRKTTFDKSSGLELKASEESVKYLMHQIDLVKKIKWIQLPSMFISGVTQSNEVTKFELLKDAKNMCQTVPDCSGVTTLRHGDEDLFELRTGVPQVSTEEEMSWLRPGS